MSRMVKVTLANCVRSLTTRITNIEVALKSLKDQKGQYADEHRTLLAAHREARAVYHKHAKANGEQVGWNAEELKQFCEME